jgi:prepilin-type N-terminal cleavage/methylation domain-containing protein
MIEPAAPGAAPDAARRFRAPAAPGFTLVEIMVAMVIFSVIGIALIALLRQSTTFLEKGQAGSEVQDVMENIDRQLADDFANVYIKPASNDGVPDVRFVADRLFWDTDNDGMDDCWSPRLSFVRSVSGEAADPLLRQAGEKAGASSVVDGQEDAKEAEEGDLRAAGGKAEVTWILVPDARAKEDRNGEIPSLGTLYRGSRMPIGGGPTQSFLPLEPWGGKKTEFSRMGITTRQECTERLRPVLVGVLHFELQFWSRHVRPEAAKLVVNGRLNDPVPPDRGGGGLSPMWDSTRGIYPKGNADGQFFLGRTGSLADPVDDVFPSRIRVTVVVDRVGKDASTGELARSIGPEDSTISVDNTRFAPAGDPAGRFIKIGREWIQWASKDARGFVVEKRGARGTKREAHEAGSTVRAGATLVREYPVPAHREDWND